MRSYTGGDTMERNMARQDDDCIQRRGTISLLNKHTDPQRTHNELAQIIARSYIQTYTSYVQSIYIEIFKQVPFLSRLTALAHCGSALLFYSAIMMLILPKHIDIFIRQKQHFSITCNTVDIVIHFIRGLVIGVNTVYLGYYATYYNIGSIALY